MRDAIADAALPPGLVSNPRTGIIVGRLDADGSRFLATTVDAELVALLSDGEPLGAAIAVESTEQGNRATLV
jgi:acetyl-CoA C-acetyltransferase